MGDFIKKYSDVSDPIGTAGVLGTSTIFDGVLGYTTANEHAGVAGVCDDGNGNGVYGRSANRNGVYGHSHAKFHSGVTGINDNETNEAGPGVYGKSKASGVIGESETWHGVAGISKSTTGGAGIYGKGEQLAALFEGLVVVRDGNIMIENDCTLNIGGKDIMMLINNLAHNIKGIRTDIRMLEVAINELRKTK